MSAFLRRLGVLVALAAGAVPRVGAAEDRFSGRATASYSGLDAVGAEAQTVQQTYEGRLRLEFSPALDGHLQLRLDDTRATTQQSNLRTSSDAQLLQPRGELRYRLAPVDLKVGYDLAWARSDTSVSSPGRTLADRVHGSAALVSPGLPSARLSVARAATRDLAGEDEVRDTTALLALDHGAGPFRMTQATQVGWLTDTGTGVTTRTVQPRGTLLMELPLGKTGSVGASYNVAYTDIAQTSVSGLPVSSPEQRFASRGLYAVSNQPSNLTDHPLVRSDALVDRNTEASTGISVGPDGVSYQNIALDMGRLVSIDALRVNVRTSSGFPASYGGGITWSVWSSTDGLLWSPVLGASTIFDSTFSRFDASFPPTTSRYFKVVNLGTNTTDMVVTELQAFEHVLVRPSATTRSNVLVQAGTFTATGAPYEKLRLTGGATVSRATQASAGTAFASNGWEAIGNAVGGPYWDRLTATLGQEVRGSSTTQTSARIGTQTTGAVQLRVADPVSTSVEGHRTEERGQADAMTSVGGRAGVSLVLLPSTLELSGSAGVDRVETMPENVRTDRYLASAAASARLFPTFTVSGSAAVETGTVNQPANAVVLFPQPPAARIYSGTALWRASERLQLGASLSYLETSQHSGIAQQYRASWDPFPGGAFRLAFTYDESIDAVNGSRLARLLVQPSWRINRHATLDASWSDLIKKEPAPVTQTQLYFLAFTVRT